MLAKDPNPVRILRENIQPYIIPSMYAMSFLEIYVVIGAGFSPVHYPYVCAFFGIMVFPFEAVAVVVILVD